MPHSHALPLENREAAQQRPALPLLQPPAAARPAPLCHRAQSASWIHNHPALIQMLSVQIASRDGQASLHQSQERWILQV